MHPTPVSASMESGVITEKEEITVGQHMAEQAQEMYGHALPADDPMSVRVRRIGAALAHLSGRRHIPYTYQVLGAVLNRRTNYIPEFLYKLL